MPKKHYDHREDKAEHLKHYDGRMAKSKREPHYDGRAKVNEHVKTATPKKTKAKVGKSPEMYEVHLKTATPKKTKAKVNSKVAGEEHKKHIKSAMMGKKKHHSGMGY